MFASQKCLQKWKFLERIQGRRIMEEELYDSICCGDDRTVGRWDPLLNLSKPWGRMWLGDHIRKRMWSRQELMQPPAKTVRDQTQRWIFSVRSISTQIKCGKGIQRPWHERRDIKSVLHNELFNQRGSFGMDEIIDRGPRGTNSPTTLFLC